MSKRFFFPVGGTGGGPTTQTFDVELWREIINRAKVADERIKVGLLTTPSELASDISDISEIIQNHKSLENDLNCAFSHLDEEKFANGEYDDQFNVLCITCGNTFGALEKWSSLGCDTTIREWYNKGVIVTGYSAGFIAFYEWHPPTQCQDQIVQSLV